MSQLKSRRRQDEDSRPNLRLVPNAKPKRRTRQRFGKMPSVWRRSLRPKYEHNRALHAYEDELILTTLRERGGYGSVQSLMREQPDRWRPGYLRKALKRLHKERRLERLGRVHHHAARYDLPKGEDRGRV